MVSLPVGAAFFSYGLIKGENIRMTAQMLVLTGCVTAILQSDLPQKIMAIGGV